MTKHIEEIADAIGYEGSFHISLSPDGYPAFSGGGCMSARDLARFGLLFARDGLDIQGLEFANSTFMSKVCREIRGPRSQILRKSICNESK